MLWLIATRVFGAPFRGDPLFFFAASILYVICTTGMGLIVSVLVGTQVAAALVTFIVTVVPTVFYSGMFVPISSLGQGGRIVARLLPAMYYTDIVTGCFLKGVGFKVLWSDVLVLAVYAATLFAIGYSDFTKGPSHERKMGKNRCRESLTGALVRLAEAAAGNDRKGASPVLKRRSPHPFHGLRIYARHLSRGLGGEAELNMAPTVVHDNHRSYASRELINRFRPPVFDVDGTIARGGEGTRMLDRGEAMVVLDIPPRFQVFAAQRPPHIQVQLDASNSVLGMFAASFCRQITESYGFQTGLKRLGVYPGQQGAPQVVDAHRVWFNPNQNDEWFMSIAELLNIITLFAILLPACAMVREKERGTVEQLLVTPLTTFQIMFPKVLAMAAFLRERP